MRERFETVLFSAANLGRGRILVSGDDAATRIAVNQALARAGYSARGTNNAATLWKWIRQGDGDVLITDIIPPGDVRFRVLEAPTTCCRCALIACSARLHRQLTACSTAGKA